MPGKIRVFLDASVLFAAVYSRSGAARDLILLAVAGQIEAVVSSDVLAEVERNISRKAPDLLVKYRQLIALMAPTVVTDPAKEAVWAAEAYVAQKDAAIVAAAIEASPDYLVTYDRKHLLEPPEVAQRSGLVIVTPAQVVNAIQDE